MINSHSSRHLLLAPMGFAWDIGVIYDAIKAGITKTRIIDLDTNLVYIANLEDFTKYGVPINRGYGEQIVLPLNRWKVIRSKNGSIQPPTQRVEA